MRLPSDNDRKSDNVIRVGTVYAIDFDSKPPTVRVEVDSGVYSDWAVWAMPVVGETIIWAAPKIGCSGTLVSEAGENSIVRFYPSFLTEENTPDGLGENDFKMIFKNGDEIHHDSEKGDLVMNITNKTTINTKEFELNAEDKATINTKQFELNAENQTNINTKTYVNDASSVAVTKSPMINLVSPNTTITGNLTSGALSRSGAPRASYTAVFHYPAHFLQPITSASTISASGIIHSGTKVTAANDGVFGGISVVNHPHGGVMTGGGNTGKPLP